MARQFDWSYCATRHAEPPLIPTTWLCHKHNSSSFPFYVFHIVAGCRSTVKRHCEYDCVHPKRIGKVEFCFYLVWVTLIRGDRVIDMKEIFRQISHFKDSHTYTFLLDCRMCKNVLSIINICTCLLYTSPSPRDQRGSRMPSSA